MNLHPIIESDLEEIVARRSDWDRFHQKTVLITGAYGMLASYVTFFFMYLHEKKGVDVTLIPLVRSREKFMEKIIGALPDYIHLRTDSLEAPLLIDEPIDFIIHAASLASPQHYEVRPIEVLSPNAIGTFHLLHLAAEKNVEGFLLFSTGDVYGSVTERDFITEEDFGVMDTLDIHNCYSESKRMAETMCKAFSVQKNVPTKMVRIWHTYAPTMDIENDPRVFSSFVKNVVNGEDIVMKSAGTAMRSFCYITDAVAGYLTVLLEGVDAEAYNVCNTSQFVSVAELGERLCKLSPKNVKLVIKERDKSEHYTENVLQLNHPMTPSNEKLMRLGWEAKINIDEGFGRVIAYQSDHIKNER